MSNILEIAGAFLEELFRRIGKVIHFQGMTQQKWTRLAIVILIYIIVRPWLMKLGAKVTDQEYTKMEARDKERMDRDKAAAAVNNLRGGGKPAANETESEGTTTAAEEQGTESLSQRATYRAQKAAEAQAMAEEERRIAMLENWEDDEEFLKNFAGSSDRSHAKRV